MAGPYYWVGGSGNWSDATNHWATASGGAPNVANVPGSADDVHFDAASNTTAYTVTLDGVPQCRDLMFDAAPSVSGTITLNGSPAFYVCGSIKLLAGMSNLHGGLVDWRAISGTKTLTSNGVNFSRHLLIRGTGGAILQLADDLTFLPGWSNQLYLISGTFDANSKTITMATATAGGHSVYGPLTLHNLTCVGGAVKDFTINLSDNVTIAGTLTLTGNSTTNRLLIQSSNLGTPRTITVAAVALTNCDFMDIVGAGAATWQGTLSAESITAAADRDFTSDTGHWTRGTGITIAGNSLRFTAAPSLSLAYLPQPTYLTLTSGKTYRIAYTIQNYSAGGLAMYPGGATIASSTKAANGSYVDTIIADNGGELYFAAIGTTTLDLTNVSVKEVSPLGDCLGNSGITFPRSEYMVWKTPTTGTKLWSAVGNWFCSTNGVNAGRVPLPQDNVIFDANSIGAASTVISADMPRMGKDITWTGVTNTPSWVVNASNFMFGSLTTVSGMSMSLGAPFLLSGRGSHTLNWGGLSVTGGGITYIYGPGGTYTLASAMMLAGSLSLYNGTFADAGYSVTVSGFESANTTVRTLNATGAWTITGSGSAWTIGATNLTWTSAPAVVKFTDATATVKVFASGSKGYNTIELAGAGSGAYSFTGSPTFTEFKISGGPKTIYRIVATTITAASYTGFEDNVATIGSSTAATHTWAKSGGGTVKMRGATVSYSIASPAATFYAGATGTDGGNNTNWTFNNAPASASAAITADSATLAATATNAIVAASVIEAEAATLTATATNAIAGAGAIAADPATLAATAANAITGSAAIVEDDTTQAAAGEVWTIISDPRFVARHPPRKFTLT